MAKLESLIVDLQANTANLQKGLDQANRQLASFDQQVKSLTGLFVFEQIGAKALEAGAAIAEFVGKGIDSLDKMGKEARAFGESSESFSRLSYAFRQGGVDGDQFGKMLGGLGKNLSAAATGSQEQVALFRALGVSATDAAGAVRKPSDVLAQLADKFAGLRDGAAKSQLAIELFGKGGEAMVETLSKGSAGLRDLEREADAVGATMGSGATAAAGAFNDSMTKLKSVTDGIGQTLAAQVLPPLNVLIDRLMKSEPLAKALSLAVDGLGLALKGAAILGSVAVAALDGMLDTLAHLGNAIGYFVSGFWGKAKQEAEAAKESYAAMGQAMKSAFLEAARPPPSPPADEKVGKGSAEAVLRAAERQKEALAAQKKAADDAKKALADLTLIAQDYERKVSTFGQAADPVAELTARIESGDLKGKFAAIGDQAEVMKDRILSAAAALQDLADQKFSHELKLNIQLQMAGLARDTQQQQQEHEQSGMTPLQRARSTIALSGFNSQAEAIDAFASRMKKSFEYGAKAAEAARDGNADAAANYKILESDAANSATAANEAARAYDEVAVLTREEMLAKLKAIGQIFAQGALQLMGPLGDLVNSIAQGAEQGGVWGAIIAAFMEIAKKTASAMHFVDVAMEFIGKLAQMVEPLIKPIFEALTNVLGVILDVVAPIFTALQPLFNAFSSAISGLAPILYSLGDLFKGLAPILQFIGNFVQTIIDITKPFNELLAGVIKVVATVLLGIIIAFNELAAAFGDKKAAAESKRLQKVISDMWSTSKGEGDAAAAGNALERDTAIKKAQDAVANAAADAAKAAYQAAVDKGASTIDAEKAGAAAAKEVTDAAAAKAAQTWDAAKAAGQSNIEAAQTVANAMEWGASATEANAKATETATKAVQDFAASLTNVPTGFRYAAAAFNSQGLSSDAVFGAPQERNITLEIDGEKLADIMERIAKRRTFRRNGFGGTQ